MPFLQLPVLSTVVYAFLKLIALNKKYTLNNESIYPFRKGKENLPIFMKLTWRSFLFCFFFTLNFHLLEFFFSNIFCSSGAKFGADCTCHHISSNVVQVSVLQRCSVVTIVLAYLDAVARMILYATTGRGKEWVQMFISVVSAMWDQR